MVDLFWSPIIDPIRASVPAHSHSGGIDHIEHHFLTALVRIQESTHSISKRPSNLLRKVNFVLGWFDRYQTSNREEAAEDN